MRIASSSRSTYTCASAATSAGQSGGKPVLIAELLERGSQSREDALVGGCDFLAAVLRERTEQLLFLVGETSWHVDVDPHDELAASPTAQCRHAASLEPEFVSGLRPGLHDQLLGPL